MDVQDVQVTILADGPYGGEGNRKLVAEKNINLVTTDFQSRKPNEIFADFIFSEDGKELIKCVGGQEPISNKYSDSTGRCRSKMNLEKCLDCPYLEACNPKLQTKSAVLFISSKTVERAKLLKTMNTVEFKEFAKKRNGVEFLHSIMRRKYGVDKMPVRGRLKTKLYFGFKVAALNFKKLCKFYDNLFQCTTKPVMG